MMEKVVVLMSTYNGEQYIDEQVKSILNQKGINKEFELVLIIRDDGSTDETVNYLSKLAKVNDNVFIMGKLNINLGVKVSFFDLLNNAPEATLYFFSDQDDVWPKNKIERFIYHYNLLDEQGKKEPVGLYSDLWVADEFGESKSIKMSEMYDWSLNADYKYLSWNYRVTGAAFAINRSAQKLLNSLENNTINEINMHDSFISLIISVTGKLIKIDEPLLYYRQHANNVIGASHANKNIIQRFKLLFSTVEQLEKDNLLLMSWINDNEEEVKLNESKNYFKHFNRLRCSKSLIERLRSWRYLSANITLNKIKIVSFIKMIFDI